MEQTSSFFVRNYYISPTPSKFKIKLLVLIWKDSVTLEHDSDNEYHD